MRMIIRTDNDTKVLKPLHGTPTTKYDLSKIISAPTLLAAIPIVLTIADAQPAETDAKYVETMSKKGKGIINMRKHIGKSNLRVTSLP